MSAPPYMPLYVGDYLADTTHLTCTEHGAYTLLLMTMWRAGGSLPSDPAKLARFARCTTAQWARMAPTILAFFDISDGRISQQRLAREMTKHSGAVRRKRELPSNDSDAKSLKTQEPDSSPAGRRARQPEPEPDREERTATIVAVPKKVLNGSRLPEDWLPEGAGWTMALDALGGDLAAVNELDRFRDYWRSVPGAKGRKADWPATWRNWVRRASENTRSRPATGPPVNFMDRLEADRAEVRRRLIADA